MRRLIGALVLGVIASAVLAALGQNQPGRWIRQLIQPDPTRTVYDLYVHDRYVILDPVAFVVNSILLGAIAYLAIWFVKARLRHRVGGAGA